MKHCFAILLLVPLFAGARDYSRYYDWINKGEETFVDRRDASCLVWFDSAFAAYDQPFVKDCYVAAQIAWYLGDTTGFLDYIDRGFANGLPLTSVKAAPMLRQLDKSPVWKDVERRFITHARDRRPIDQDVADRIYAYYHASDSIKVIMGTDPAMKARFNEVENEFRQYLFDEFLVKGIFPNERIIGIATPERYTSFLERTGRTQVYPVWAMADMEYELCAKFSFNILLHAHCSFVKYHDELVRAMQAGYLHPKDFAILHETAKSWGASDTNPWNDCQRPPERVFYNVFNRKPFGVNTFFDSPEDLITVEANRAAIHLQKYAVDLRKKQVQNETGIWFFFDFQDRIR